jgi:hypothetical protein
MIYMLFTDINYYKHYDHMDRNQALATKQG